MNMQTIVERLTALGHQFSPVKGEWQSTLVKGDTYIVLSLVHDKDDDTHEIEAEISKYRRTPSYRYFLPEEEGIQQLHTLLMSL